MNKIQLTPKIKIDADLNLEELSKINILKSDKKKLGMIRIKYRNRICLLRDIFKINIKKNSVNKLLIKKANIFFQNLGVKWQNDLLEIFGDVGSFLGANMINGKIVIHGSCLNFLGSNMSGGEIIIKNNAGNFVGSSSSGSLTGMKNGKIYIHGNAGDYLAYKMRRGLIMIKGNVGNNCANLMIAGTIVVNGNIGNDFCLGMKRGSLLLNKKPKKLLSRFKDCGLHELNYYKIFNSLFRNFGFKKASAFKKFVGDTTNSGLGEILIADN
tara:strand:- start:1090 stop:1896 length:807 start_codon:yes stop_codon:yes gene_type:complete